MRKIIEKRFIIAQLSFALIVLFVSSTEAEYLQEIKEFLYDNYEIDAYGFMEARCGYRLQDDPYQKDASIAEVRLQTDLSKEIDRVELKLKFDLLGDRVLEEFDADLREFYLAFTPVDFMDVKVGRQILTWGTGDLLFINDLFPKDWVSFFIGRDVEYLKAPSDAVRVSLFFDFLNVDIVYVPEFCGSDYIDGSRLSYWNDLLGRTAGRDFVFSDDCPNDFGKDAEYSIRLSKNITGLELALYGYYGFWKEPEGLDLSSLKLIYPELFVCGSSVRGAMLGGIGSAEVGYYYTREDASGKDPLMRNSEVRFLAGFEKELARNLTGGIQYYLEYMQDYDEYENSLPVGMEKTDEFRHVLTLRLTQMLMNQNLKLSFFTFYSPSDADGYARPKIHYKISDYWSAEIGGNIFFGEEDYTFFGQFKDNTNAYAAVRLNF
jgi:hypothetical protein